MFPFMFKIQFFYETFEKASSYPVGIQATQDVPKEDLIFTWRVSTNSNFLGILVI